MNDYRYPNITAKEPAEKLRQIESFLRQLVDKMNAEQSSTGRAIYTYSSNGERVQANDHNKTDAENTFETIKDLILKSADIVDSFYEKYSKKLSGYYVAKSEFGEYKEENEVSLEATAKEIELAINQIESVAKSVANLGEETEEKLLKISASAEELSINVSKIVNDGVDSVKTKKGYTFNDEGLRIESAGSSIVNQIDNTGMSVKRGDDVMLKADHEGVIATDVQVNNYLIVGEHARFEDFPSGRTACFYVQ